MANVRKMNEFFDIVDSIITELSQGDVGKKDLLNTFFIRVLTVIDGQEGLDIKWNGIALVAPEDLPDHVEEINDDFLHDAWSDRR